MPRRTLDVARRFLAAISYRHGFFNLEFFHDEVHDRLSVSECNPRLASQFGDLYRRVLGIDAHAMAVSLALGDDPLRVPRTQPTSAVAASLVYRAFRADAVPTAPSPAQRLAFSQSFPGGLRSPWDRIASRLRDWRFTQTQLGMGCIASGRLLVEPIAEPFRESGAMDSPVAPRPRDTPRRPGI